jgi:hypothetical protein
MLASRGEIAPPTIWQKAPFGAFSKRGEVHPIDHPDLLLTNLDALDQCPDDLPARGPVRLLQTCLHPLGELL